MELQQLRQVGHELTDHPYVVLQLLAYLVVLLTLLITDDLVVTEVHLEEGVLGQEGVPRVVAAATLGTEHPLVHVLVGREVVVELYLVIGVDDILLITGLERVDLHVDEVVDDLDDLVAHLAGVPRGLEVLQGPVELTQVALPEQSFELGQLSVEETLVGLEVVVVLPVTLHVDLELFLLGLLVAPPEATHQETLHQSQALHLQSHDALQDLVFGAVVRQFVLLHETVAEVQ